MTSYKSEQTCRDDFITHKDTSDWSSADPYSRASTDLKKLITRLRDILQGRYTTDPCHHCIRFCGCLIVSSTTNGTLRPVAYTCVTSLLWLQCTIASSTPTVHSLRPVVNVRLLTPMRPCRMGGTVYLPALCWLAA
jgi:hypothetical protein